MPQAVAINTKNNQPVILRKLNLNDLDRLADYLHHLSDESKKRFGPHGYDKKSLIDFYSWPNVNTGFVAADLPQGNIIAYSIIKNGYLPHDKQRLESYAIKSDEIKCCTFAPSVADAWQNLGVGKNMLDFILKELRIAGIQNIILWGGVQCDNYKAVRFYKKAGFKTLGQFEYSGSNYDMMLTIGS